MNGRINGQIVCDTNTAIRFIDKKIIALPAGDILVSVITEMELLAFPSLTPVKEREILTFLKRTFIVPLTEVIKHEAIRIRRFGTPRLKLPDAIIAATACVLDAALVTNDDDMLKLNWPGLAAVEAR